MKARSSDHIEKIFEIFFDAIFRRCMPCLSDNSRGAARLQKVAQTAGASSARRKKAYVSR